MSVENEPQIATLFGEVRNNIAVALEAARSDVRVLQKVAWLANYFNASLRRLVSEDIGGLQNVRSIEVARP